MISVDQVIDNQLEMKVEMKKMSDKLNKKSEYICWRDRYERESL